MTRLARGDTANRRGLTTYLLRRPGTQFHVEREKGGKQGPQSRKRAGGLAVLRVVFPERRHRCLANA